MVYHQQLRENGWRSYAPSLIESRTTFQRRQGIEFMPELAPALQLFSVKQRAEHLYLRYGRAGGHPPMA